MNADSETLCVGLIELQPPRLLILGSEQSLRWLASTILERRSVDLRDEPQLVWLANVNVEIVAADTDSRLERHADRLIWTISASDAREFADLLVALASADHPAHTYLDMPSQAGMDIEIVASKNEYAPATVFGEAGFQS